MISKPTTITRWTVPSIYRHRCLWKFYDADGNCYTTTDMFLAALAKRYCDKRVTVTIQSGEGWYFRDLRNVVPVLEGDHV